MTTKSAEPVLGSALWQAYKQKHDIDDLKSFFTRQPAPGLLTGCKSIDQILAPGLDYGENGICHISSAPDAGGREILFSLITSHLLASPASIATIIDSVGLDLLALYNTIKARLTLQPHINPNLPPRDLDSEATALLERVSISRVFTFEGLAEAVSEFQATCNPTSLPLGAQAFEEDRPKMRSTIPDSQSPGPASQQEEEDLFALLDHPDPTPSPNPTAPTNDTTVNPAPKSKRLLVLHDLPTIFSPLQRESYISSSALLSSLLRSLNHLSLQHDLCVLLLNGLTTPSKPSLSPQRNPDPGDGRPADREGSREGGATRQRGPSIFSSAAERGMRPLFWHVLDGGTGMAVMVHRIERGPEGRKGREMVGCVEVIADRGGGRRERFAFFETDGRGQVRDVVR